MDTERDKFGSSAAARGETSKPKVPIQKAKPVHTSKTIDKPPIATDSSKDASSAKKKTSSQIGARRDKATQEKMEDQNVPRKPETTDQCQAMAAGPIPYPTVAAPVQYPPSVGPEQHLTSVALEQYPPSVSPDQHPSSVGPDQHPPSVGPDQHPPSVGPDQHPPSVGPDQHPPSVGPDQHPPSVDPDQHPPSVGPDQHQPSVGPDQYPPSAAPVPVPVEQLASAPTVAGGQHEVVDTTDQTGTALMTTGRPVGGLPPRPEPSDPSGFFTKPLDLRSHDMSAFQEPIDDAAIVPLRLPRDQQFRYTGTCLECHPFIKMLSDEIRPSQHPDRRCIDKTNLKNE